MLPSSLSLAAVLLVSLAATTALVPADPAPAPAIGMPGCEASCGNVSVPYPFGIGPSHCYMPGFNLTCEHGTLLLGGEFEVTHIFLNGTMRVVARDVQAIDMGSSGVGHARWGGGLGGNGGPYAFGTLFQNELVVTGCNVQARLLGGTNGSSVLGGCSAFCHVSEPSGLQVTGLVIEDQSSICTGIGCCQGSIPVGYSSYDLLVTRLAGDEAYGVPVHALVAEIGWLTPHRAMDLTRTTAAAAAPVEVPVILTWSVRHRVEARDPDTTLCMDIGNGDYMCLCMAGYKGNPYLPRGCQDAVHQKGMHEVSSAEKQDQIVAATKELPLWSEVIARVGDKFNNKLSQEEIAELTEIFKMVIQERENSAKLRLSDQVVM